MPTSKETRVRVEGFSKIIARDMPVSGASVTVRRPALNALPRSIMARSVPPSSLSSEQAATSSGVAYVRLHPSAGSQKSALAAGSFESNVTFCTRKSMTRS